MVSRSKRIAALLSFLLFGGVHCSGAVIFIDVEDREYHFLEVDTSVPFIRDDFDLNDDGLADFFIEYSQFRFQVVPTGGNRVGATEISTIVPSWAALVINRGEEIGAILGENWIPSYERLDGFGEIEFVGAWLNDLGGLVGPLSDVHRGYIGIEFQIETDIHYGWVAIENDPEEHLVSGRLTGWAYETIPRKSIQAGVIPEPKVCLLFLIGIFVITSKRNRAADR